MSQPCLKDLIQEFRDLYGKDPITDEPLTDEQFNELMEEHYDSHA